jgi:hypothetical protein
MRMDEARVPEGQAGEIPRPSRSANLVRFEIEPMPPGATGTRSRLIQAARFLPRGLRGLAH